MNAGKKIFFNYGTVGLMNKSVYKATRKFLDEYFLIGPPEILYKYEPLTEKLAEEAAKLLHCDPDEITYIKNTTEGMNIASETLPIKKRDEVIVSGNEYPATLLVWMKKKKKEGVVLRVLTGPDNESIVRSILTAINPQTKVVVISWAQCSDGYLPNLQLLSTVCRKKGIYLVVDGVQGVGVRFIDLKKTPVDMLICGGQKYLGGIMGIGFMYINKHILPRLHESKIGIRSVQRFDIEESSYVLKDTAKRFEDGTMNLVGVVALHTALKHLNSIGIKNIEKKNLELQQKFKKILRKSDIPFIDHKEQSNIIALEVEEPEELQKYLLQKNMYIKVMKNRARLSYSHTSQVVDFKKIAMEIKAWMEMRSYYKNPLSRKVIKVL